MGQTGANWTISPEILVEAHPELAAAATYDLRGLIKALAADHNSATRKLLEAEPPFLDPHFDGLAIWLRDARGQSDTQVLAQDSTLQTDVLWHLDRRRRSLHFRWTVVLIATDAAIARPTINPRAAGTVTRQVPIVAICGMDLSDYSVDREKHYSCHASEGEDEPADPCKYSAS